MIKILQKILRYYCRSLFNLDPRYRTKYPRTTIIRLVNIQRMRQSYSAKIILHGKNTIGAFLNLNTKINDDTTNSVLLPKRWDSKKCQERG